MSSLHDTILGWVDQRVGDMLAAPRTWGSNEAVEMQILQLMELRALALHPAQELESPRRILETYLAYLRDRFPAKPPMPLFQLVGQDEPGAQTAEHLRGFVEAITPGMLEESPSQPKDIAGSAPEPFDKRDEIRAIDLDRGLLLLGKKARIPCYVRPELLGDITFVGVEARVIGTQYHPLGGRPFVLAEAIEVVSGILNDDG
jgi:hypothetical protein